MPQTLPRLAAACLIGALWTSACDVDGSDHPDPESADSCAAVIENLSGNPDVTVQQILQFHDPVATEILEKGSCATTFKAIMKQLVASASSPCGGSAPAVGIALVSERAAVLGRPEPYRAVVTCRNDSQPLLLSPFGQVSLDDPEPPADVEVMAFDTTSGLFNFYAAEGGKWRFFGSSTDMLEGEGDTAIEFRDRPRRCAECHAAGGPVMKEFSNPWFNWEGKFGDPHSHGGFHLPGNDEVLDRFADELGLVGVAHMNGPAIASITNNGNSDILRKQLDHIESKHDIAALLGPLFCTREINLSAGSTFPLAQFAAPELTLAAGLVATDLAVSPGQYRAALTRAGQIAIDARGTPLHDADGKLLRDIHTFFRAGIGIADQSYIGGLEQDGVLDQDFIVAVYALDLTRPILSDKRCQLLADLAPDIEISAAKPRVATLRARFITALEHNLARPASERNPLARQFLDHLTGQGETPQARVVHFVEQCQARIATDPAGFADDALAAVSIARAKLRAMPIVEAPELLPFDPRDLPETGHLSPETCELVED